MYYHLEIYTKTEPRQPKYRYDLNESELQTEIIMRYRASQVLLVEGKSVHSQYIERIKIVQTDENISEWRRKLQDKILAEAQRGGPRATIIAKWRVFQDEPDITVRFLPELQGENQSGTVTSAPMGTTPDNLGFEDISLTPAQRREFASALASAFPSYMELSRLLDYSLGWNLETIAGTGQLEDVISRLVTRVRAEGRVRELLEAAIRERPRNPELSTFANSLNIKIPTSASPDILPLPPVSSSASLSSTQTTTSGVLPPQGEATQPSNPRPSDSRASWKPWADHPIIVLILLIATVIPAVIATVTFLASFNNSRISQSSPEPTTTLTSVLPTATTSFVAENPPTITVPPLVPSATSLASSLSSPTPRVRVKRFDFDPPSPTDQENVFCYVCTEGCGGVNVTIKVEVNRAADSSPSGEWIFLKEMDTPCYTEDNAPFWHNLDFPDGPHLVRVTIKDCKGGVQTLTSTYTLDYRQPSHPYLISPAPDSTLKSRTVTFQWQEALRAMSYTLWVGTKEKPEDAPILHEIITGTVYTTTFPTDYAQLYWRVDAQNDKGRTQVGSQAFSIVSTEATAFKQPLYTYLFTAYKQQLYMGLVDWGGYPDAYPFLRK